MTVAKFFHYEILNILPLEFLENFKEHRRLRVFYHKGTKCVSCGRTGTLLALGKGRKSFHWDIYTDDFYPLTVDHTIPKSKGGSNDLFNLQPMCCTCNWEKGNGEKPHKRALTPELPKAKRHRRVTTTEMFKIGDTIYNNHGKYIGIIEKIEINPRCPKKSMAAVVVDKPGSWYNLEKIHTI